MDLKKEKKEKPVKEKKTKEKKGGSLDVSKLKNYFNKNTFLGITLVGLLAIVVVYVLVFMDYTEKTEEVEAANRELQATVNELQQYADNMEMYQSEISEMKTAIEDIIAEYPADAREEDIIMLAVQVQERNAIAYDALNMEATEGVYTVPADNVRLAAIEGLDGELTFAQKHAVYVNTTNYDNLKSVVEQIFDSDNRIGINSIVYSKNEENGTLEGSIDLNFYSAIGTGKEYVVPDIAAYLSGTSDLFQSDKVASKNNVGEEGGEAEDNGEEAQEN